MDIRPTGRCMWIGGCSPSTPTTTAATTSSNETNPLAEQQSGGPRKTPRDVEAPRSLPNAGPVTLKAPPAHRRPRAFCNAPLGATRRSKTFCTAPHGAPRRSKTFANAPRSAPATTKARRLRNRTQDGTCPHLAIRPDEEPRRSSPLATIRQPRRQVVRVTLTEFEGRETKKGGRR